MASKTVKLLQFVSLIGKLKTTQRTGWVYRNVKNPESVADHMYRMSMLAFLVDPNSGLCRDRCIKLSLVHDLAECIVGDITPSDGISKSEKHQKEKQAMEDIVSLVDEGTKDEFLSLWEEYESMSTPEAKFVKDLDRFDMIFQAYEYEQEENRPGDLQDFFESTKGKFQHPQVQEWVQELNNQRCESMNKEKKTKVDET